MRGPIKLRILVVEDDARMLDLLSQGLREAGHTVMPASDGKVGLELATGFSFDAIVLDIGLPVHNGYDITRALRQQASGNKTATPILMLTARDAEDDILRGFDVGADDYLIKPFSFPELLARLNALVRAAHATKSRNSLLFDAARGIVVRDNATVQLTRTEFLLLQLLAEHVGKPVTRQRLIQGVWGNAPVHSNTLDVFINALRSKFDVPFASRLIVTVRGIGYRLQLENDSAHRTCQEIAG